MNASLIAAMRVLNGPASTAPVFSFVADPDRKAAEQLVLDYHYSKRLPSNVQGVFGLNDANGDLVAAIFFSIPPTRWSESVFELTRLVRKDGIKVPLTYLISKATKELRRRKGADLIVSFADNTQGHHGGIYQASSWAFHEMRKPAHDGFLIDGKFVPRRTCNSNWRTSSRTDLPELLWLMGYDWTVVPHYDSGKFLYWKSMGKSGDAKAERLRLGRKAYPKPANDNATDSLAHLLS